MHIYHLANDYHIALSAYEVERETAQLYFVRDGITLTGDYAHYVRCLKKDDLSVFIDRDTALAACRVALETAFTNYEAQIAGAEQALQALLAACQWVVTDMTYKAPEQFADESVHGKWIERLRSAIAKATPEELLIDRRTLPPIGRC